MNEIIQMNKGVWFFKNKKWKKASEIWIKIEQKNKKINSSITSDIFKPIFFPISLAWNQALINYHMKEYKTALEKIKTVMVLLQTLEKDKIYEELALSGSKFFRQKFLMFIQNYEMKLKSH